MVEGKDDRPGVDETQGGASEQRPSNDREALESALAAAREEACQNHDRWLRAVAEHLLAAVTSGPLRSRDFVARARVDSPGALR